jgi:Carboxypeptidase regulatory-like domain
MATRTVCGSSATLGSFVLAEQIGAGFEAENGAAPASIAGLVVDSNGEPISGVAVKLTGAETRLAETDSDGFFHFVNLTPNANYNVQPKQVGYLFTEYSLDFVNLTGENTVVFTGTQSVFSISGRVRNGNGNGVSNIVVQLDGAFSNLVTTDANGNYSFPNLPADGSYTITPTSGNGSYSPAQIVINPLTGDITGADFTQFAPTAARVSASGRILTAQGRALSKARVSITNSQGETRSALSNSFGHYRFEDVAAGETYILSVSGKGYQFIDNPRVVFVLEELSDVNFRASP